MQSMFIKSSTSITKPFRQLTSLVRNAQIGYDNSAIGMFKFILLHMYLPNQVFIQPNKILFFDILISVAGFT